MLCKKPVKQVRETTAGKAIDAYVIMKKEKVVAYVHVLHTQNAKGPLKRIDIFQPRSSTTNFQQCRGQTVTSALHGAKIDDVRLFDDCTTSEVTKDILAKYKAAKTDKARRTIVEQAQRGGMTWGLPTPNGYESLYYIGGFERLKAFGYQVIQAF